MKSFGCLRSRSRGHYVHRVDGAYCGCSRCHDHKFDPILQKEYYQLFAYFNNVPEKGFVYNYGNEEPYIKAPTPPQKRAQGV